MHIKRGSSLSNLKHQSQHNKFQKNKITDSNQFIKNKSKSPSLVKR